MAGNDARRSSALHSRQRLSRSLLRERRPSSVDLTMKSTLTPLRRLSTILGSGRDASDILTNQFLQFRAHRPAAKQKQTSRASERVLIIDRRRAGKAKRHNPVSLASNERSRRRDVCKNIHVLTCRFPSSCRVNDRISNHSVAQSP